MKNIMPAAVKSKNPVAIPALLPSFPCQIARERRAQRGVIVQPVGIPQSGQETVEDLCSFPSAFFCTQSSLGIEHEYMSKKATNHASMTNVAAHEALHRIPKSWTPDS